VRSEAKGDIKNAGDTVTSDVVLCSSCGTRNRVPAAASGTPRCASCHTNLSWLVEATDADFDTVTDSRLPVLVDLWAPWCGPCRMVAPAVERAAQQNAGRLKVVKVNVDQAPGISARLGVQGVPTLLLLRQGEVTARQVGALPEHHLLAWVNDSLDSLPA
jgi:thioredoxin 2